MAANRLPIDLRSFDPIHFALLLPITGYWNTANNTIAGAAALAVEKVNKNPTLLRGRVLEYSWADSGCSAQQGLIALAKLFTTETQYISAVIGPGCSPACEATR